MGGRRPRCARRHKRIAPEGEEEEEMEEAAVSGSSCAESATYVYPPVESIPSVPTPSTSLKRRWTV